MKNRHIFQWLSRVNNVKLTVIFTLIVLIIGLWSTSNAYAQANQDVIITPPGDLSGGIVIDINSGGDNPVNIGFTCGNNKCEGTEQCDGADFCFPQPGAGFTCEQCMWVNTCVPSTEVCDGLDNDCDNSIDEGFNVGNSCSVGVGECLETGTVQCKPNQTGTICSAVPGTPSPEQCDGLDNNCNGSIDERLTRKIAGQCSDGKEFCSNANWEIITPAVNITTEICGDGIDQDCDGSDLTCAPPDADGDGYASATDCDDNHAAIYPGANEVCDGLDNDCDNAIDEGVTNACGSCGNVPVETCNNKDDDCDGTIDEDGVCICHEGDVVRSGTNAGECEEGVKTCIGNAWVETTEIGPKTETCNGLDDNCDGSTDEGVRNACGGCGDIPEVACILDSSNLCQRYEMRCVDQGKGSYTKECFTWDDTTDINNNGQPDCNEALPVILDPTCDNDGTLDGLEECDGSATTNPGFHCENCLWVQDIVVCDDGQTQECQVENALGVCALGTQECLNNQYGTCESNIVATLETCDGLDNDCNEIIDDSLIDADLDGSTLCDDCDDNDVARYPGNPEMCDDKDNDCNGAIDDGIICECDGTETRDCGFIPGITCTPGIQTCQNGQGWSDCEGFVACPEESCNGVDDDNDNSVDEGFDVDADGFFECIDDCNDLDPTINPNATETCNQVDDDCDGTVDEDDVCADECNAETEVCDGVDNDCDNEIDEGVTNACGTCDELPADCTEDGVDEDCDGLDGEDADLADCGVAPPGLAPAETNPLGTDPAIFTTDDDPVIGSTYKAVGGPSCALNINVAPTTDAMSILIGFGGFLGLWFLRKVIVS